MCAIENLKCQLKIVNKIAVASLILLPVSIKLNSIKLSFRVHHIEGESVIVKSPTYKLCFSIFKQT